jgi:hypothetical protein
LSTVRTGVGMGILLGLVMSVLLWASASPAQAQTVDECQTKIDNLKAATQTANFIGQKAEQNRTGLTGKLDNASQKLTEGKYQDAIQKLTDFRTTVNTLEAQGKLAPADAQILRTGADEAIACVQDLINTQAASAA